jgi:hypothetical protein
MGKLSWTNTGPATCEQDERGKHGSWRTLAKPSKPGTIEQVCGLCGLGKRWKHPIRTRVTKGDLL